MAKAKSAAEPERLKAKAIARWESEGGALGAYREEDQTLSEAERRLLTGFGAAVLSEWSNLPSDLQRAIASRAATPHDGSRTKAELARFLHDYKDH